MSELISGKEALIALANGEEVEVKLESNKWSNNTATYSAEEILAEETSETDDYSSMKLKFRLKPHTITINGIEVPASFNGQLAHKQYAYVLSTAHPKGYSDIKFYDGNAQPSICWKDEDEIKQVVAALRQIFK